MKKLIFLIIGAVVTIIFTANGSDNYKVVDGDSLEQGTVRIRLIGIDAPEFLQECQDKDGQSYRCGNKATEYLQSLMNGKIKCHHIDKDRYNRNLSECLNGENLNINRQMVLSGWAVAYGDNYKDEEKDARLNERGIWQGKFMRPELFRSMTKAKDKRNKIKKR